MTDYIDTPVEEPATPAPDSRVLSPDEEAAYAALLMAVGFDFVANESGFDVTGNGQVFNYRYDAAHASAVALLDRICAERGA